ncbi:MAG: hypothetical protein IPQ09_25705 [Myxococcales bacterium]|nr:hypothetical protein [Myxococcales bacterium]
MTILLRFRCGGVLECRIPPPGRLLAFTDRHGVPLEPGTAVSAYALSGLHARYAAPPGGLAPVLDVEARLRGARPELIGRLAPTDDGTQAVHLEALRDRIDLLFASIRPGGGGPRREAEGMRLSLSERGGRAADRHDLELRRDDAQFEPEKHDDHQILRLVTAGNAFGDFRELRVEATPVWDPAAAPEPLEPIGDARFRFPYAGRRPGPWLVTGWLGSTMPMRALLVTVPGDPAAHVSHRSLAWAVCLHDHEARAREMKRIFDRLARAWSDPEWAEVDAYLEKLGVYPAHTFDVVRALVDHPEALAVALLRAHDPSELERRARHLELLPMAWCLVPLRAWLQAGIAAREEAVRQSEACTNAGIEGFGVKRCVEDLLRPTVGAAHPEILPCVREVWPLVCADFPSSGPGPLLERAQRDGLVQAVAPGLLEQLRQRHPGERWPQLHLEDATSCWNDVKRMQDQFAATHIADFQRDVVRAPVLAARLLLDDTHVARDRPELLRAIRRARAFDQAWFDDTQALALAFLLGERLEHNADYLDTLAGI